MSDTSSTNSALGDAVMKALRQWDRWQTSDNEYEQMEEAMEELRGVVASSVFAQWIAEEKARG